MDGGAPSLFNQDQDATFLCLGANNVLYQVRAGNAAGRPACSRARWTPSSSAPSLTHCAGRLTPRQVDTRHISGVLGDAAAAACKLDLKSAVQEVQVFAEGLRLGSWRALGADVLSADGSVLTALAATQLPPSHTLTPILPAGVRSTWGSVCTGPGDAAGCTPQLLAGCTKLARIPRSLACPRAEEGLAALRGQRARVQAVKAQLAELKADRRFMRAAKKFSKQAAQAAALQERAAALREDVGEQLDSGWRAFEDLLGVLVDAGGWAWGWVGVGM